MKTDIFTPNPDDTNFVFETDDEIKKFNATYHEEIFSKDAIRKLKLVQQIYFINLKNDFVGWI